VLNFFERLPNPDKQLTVMPGIAHTSLRSKNWRMVYDLIDSCCSRTGPVYTGKAHG
jgi:alpha-beta hydrolase superfamily lysophospholipase